MRAWMGSLFSIFFCCRWFEGQSHRNTKIIIIILASRLSENRFFVNFKITTTISLFCWWEKFSCSSNIDQANEMKRSLVHKWLFENGYGTHHTPIYADKRLSERHFVWQRYKCNRVDKWNANRCMNSRRNYDCVNKTKLLQSNLVSTLNAIHSLLRGSIMYAFVLRIWRARYSAKMCASHVAEIKWKSTHTYTNSVGVPFSIFKMFVRI